MPAEPRRSRREALPKRRRLKWNFAEWFVLSQTFLPALLYLPGSQPFRVPIRMGSYGISLLAFLYCWAVKRSGLPSKTSPATACLLMAVAYMVVMLAHPATNSLVAGVAQLTLYFCILSPVFWAQHFVESPQRLRRLLWLLLLCCGVNAFVGVMQVRNPATWLPKEFSSVMIKSVYGLGASVYQGADGQYIVRPPGLLDAPGAVAGPATFALYLGLVFAGSDRNWIRKAVATTFAVLGAMAIFFSMVRSSFLIVMGMLVVYLLSLVGQRRVAQAGVLIAVATLAITFAFAQAVVTGGENISGRFQSILEEDPRSFYYNNRGTQVASSLTEILPSYPFGAGLGRHGMIHSYFGRADSDASSYIPIEIQVPAWIVDGGIVLLLLYPLALIITVWTEARMTFRHPSKPVRALAGIILAVHAGLLCLCFSYEVFLSPLGTQFWFFAGALQGVHLTEQRRMKAARREARRAAGGQTPAAAQAIPAVVPCLS